jgi:hypothetical protein
MRSMELFGTEVAPLIRAELARPTTSAHNRKAAHRSQSERMV